MGTDIADALRRRDCVQAHPIKPQIDCKSDTTHVSLGPAVLIALGGLYGLLGLGLASALSNFLIHAQMPPPAVAQACGGAMTFPS